VTTARALIVSHGVTLGRVERRFSKTCHTWWGRIFDLRSGSRGGLIVELEYEVDSKGDLSGFADSGSPQFVSASYNIFYGRMYFNATSPQQAPQIVGALSAQFVSGNPVGPQATVSSASVPTK
jgi:hypothetical protein